jgi:hypothetical protein
MRGKIVPGRPTRAPKMIDGGPKNLQTRRWQRCFRIFDLPT